MARPIGFAFDGFEEIAFDRGRLAGNAFVVPPGLEPRVYATHVVDVLAHAYTLGNGARYLVHKALMTVYGQGNLAPRVAAVQAEIDKIPDTLRVRGWKVSALRALQSLAITADDQAHTSQEELARTLLTKSTILELDALGASDKLFLVPLLVHWLYLVKLGMPRRENLDLVIVLKKPITCCTNTSNARKKHC
ncbi:MAG: hypothetical protein IH897_10065 [Planctomycetes bacterium]|nr:hypothetical protein [Planctomycetota bacterium]